MGELDGKVAVITGAGSGMAQATVDVFVREGARVLAADITGAEEETAAKYGDEVVACHVDVSDEASVEAMFAKAVEVFGTLDAALNVAGLGSGGALHEVDMAEYDRVMNVNLRGVFLGTKHAIRTMLEHGGGVITNWSSTGGLGASPMPVSVYGASKHGVVAITKQAATEYGTRGIRANAICPGFIETPMSGGKGAAEKFPGLVQHTGLKRGGQPEEVAELASFLTSDRASFITGAAIPIDGGLTATFE